MSSQSLEDLLAAVGNPVTLARSSQIGPYVYPTVPSEFTNWHDEQHAWRETCCLFDQSHHMTDLCIKGPDAIKLLSALGVNSFATFAVNKAKQFVACNNDGYVIGDAILSAYESATGRYRGQDTILRRDDRHYSARGTVLDGGKILSAWSFELRQA